MFTNPHPLTAAEVLALCGGAVMVAVLVLLLRRRSLSLPTLVAASLLASVLVSAPFTAWAFVSDVRAARDLSPFDAARVGAESNGIDTTVIDRIARRIPEQARYAIVLAPGADPDITSVFRIWALTVLLPRVAVADARKAEWVVTFGASPARLGVSASGVRRVRSNRSRRLDAWVGVAR